MGDLEVLKDGFDMKDSIRSGDWSRLGPPRLQPQESILEIVLRDIMVPRQVFNSEHFKGGAVGLHGLLQARGAAVALAQGLKCVAEVVVNQRLKLTSHQRVKLTSQIDQYLIKFLFFC